MSFRINTNVNAMNALRNLSMTGMEASKSTTRLSTGLRINSGADDPSGLIASESYRAQLGGMDQALRNNQDAINYSKTAEGGLDEVNRLLKDARTLAVANGNGTLDETQKQANQTQLNSILASIDRVAANTSFGAKKLLNGSAGTQSAILDGSTLSNINFGGNFAGQAIGANSDVDINITQAAEQATVTSTETYANGTDPVPAGQFSLNGVNFTVGAGSTRDSLLAQINSKASETGVSAAVDGTGAFVFTSANYGEKAKVNLVDGSGILVTGGGALTDTGLNVISDVTVDGRTVSAIEGDGLTVRDSDGNSFTLTAAGNVTGAAAGVGRVTIGATSFQIGANAGQTASLSLGSFSSSSLGFTTTNSNINGGDVSAALAQIDTAISNVANARGQIGSFMKNTLESNVRSLGIARENLSATESSIREIDVAEEMTNYTKLQILQQSGLSMLSQANSGPQAVLSLLRG